MSHDPLFDKPSAVGSHPASLDDDALMTQCTLVRGRSGGPGGQHRNKVETAVTITHRSTNIVGRATERRSAEINRKVALNRLRLALAVGYRHPVPAGDARSELWQSRCRGGKVSCNPKHHDYPALLAEAMDFAAEAGWDVKKAAVRLECSTTQLIRFIKDHPPAWTAMNQQRSDRGMHRLK